jgi:hypothetical protein
LLKFFVKILFCKHYFNPLSRRKGKDPDREAQKHADRDPQHWKGAMNVVVAGIGGGRPEATDQSETVKY